MIIATAKQHLHKLHHAFFFSFLNFLFTQIEVLSTARELKTQAGIPVTALCLCLEEYMFVAHNVDLADLAPSRISQAFCTRINVEDAVEVDVVRPT